MINNNKFNDDYYERGIEKGISGYSNFRWMPEMTIPMCHHLVNHLGINEFSTILDFGCAKGYIVKALRLLGYDARGVDISDYAIQHVDSDVKRFVERIDMASELTFPDKKEKFTHIIAKDVFEHIQYNEIQYWLECLVKALKQNGKLYCLIPLATDGKYRVPFYENDVTHIIREDETWWINQLTLVGLKPLLIKHSLKGIKENWSSYPEGNLQLILMKD
jgi:cyclopropane fatty-acyl-phospholipid synthase-like methyltransferase